MTLTWDAIGSLPPTDFGLASVRLGPISFMLVWAAGWLAAFVAAWALGSSALAYFALGAAFLAGSAAAGAMRTSDIRAGYRREIAQADRLALKGGDAQRASRPPVAAPG